MMIEEFTSPLFAEMKANNGVITRGDITVKLAIHYGFCWGVERAVSVACAYNFYHLRGFLVQIAMAYEARAHFPDNTIHITNEIIHNPQVLLGSVEQLLLHPSTHDLLPSAGQRPSA